MTTKQIPGSLSAPDGSHYVTLTDGAGNLAPSSSSGNANGQAIMANSAPVVIAQDQTPVPVQPVDASGALAVTGTGTASVTSATTLFSLDTTGYSSISVQVTSPGTTTTITYEVSNDNATWVTEYGMPVNSIGSLSVAIPVTTSATAGHLVFPAFARYFRARVSTYGSGTVTAFYALRQAQLQPSIFTQLTAATSQVSLGAATSGGYSFNHITTATTTTAKSGAGTLHTIAVNKGVAVATITVYDNTAGSGTVIAVIAADNPATYTYDIAFATGCTLVTSGANDVTVSYK